jgi:hypothetical protein
VTGLRQLAIWLILCVWPWPFAGAISVVFAEDEPLLKAAFIYNFAKFTQWPEHALGAQDSQLSLCIVGEDDLVGTLGRLSGKLVKGRQLTTRIVRGTPIPNDCHILYIAASEQKRYPRLVNSVRGQAMLTVSALPGFARTGGIVELTRANGRIEFTINLGLARGAGLEISPRLLALSEVVDREQ